MNSIKSTLPEVIVREIFETSGNFARVKLDKDIYKHVIGFNKQANPALLDYSTGKDQAGRGVRIFDINGVKVYTRYDKELDTKTKTHVYMHMADVKNRLKSLEEERADEEPLGFVF